jgi:hypothetical protein
MSLLVIVALHDEGGALKNVLGETERLSSP